MEGGLVARPIIAIDARYGLRKVRRGVGEYVFQLLKHLADYDRPYDLQVLGDESADPEVVRDVSQIYPVTVVPAPNFFWWEQVAFARAARHAALWHGTANIGPLRGKVPQILTIHDVIEWHRGVSFPAQLSFRHKLSRMYRMNALKRLAPRAKAILTVSNHAKDDLVQMLGVDDTRVVVTPLAAKHTGGEPSFPKHPYFLALGASDPRKNAKTALLALQQVPAPYGLKLVGAEEQALAPLRALAESLGVGDRVDIEGMISDRKLAELYEHATAFLYPSYYEGFGLPVLEAMAHGCPVIASDRSSIPEVMGQAGIALPPDQPKRWGQVMVDLAEDRPWQVILAHEGRVRAAQFSWEQTAQLTHRIYCQGT